MIPRGRKWTHCGAAGLALLLAAGLRLHGIDFGLPALNDPDELMFELGAVRMLTGGTLNPGWFGHPATTTMYVLALVDAATFVGGWITGHFADPQAFVAAAYGNPELLILRGRLAMAAFAVLALWQTYRIGGQIGGQRGGTNGGMNMGLLIGLLAALMLACSPVHVTYSQIIRSDMMGSAFMLLCVGAAFRIADRGRWADYGWAALWLALAVASKWPFAIAALSVAGAGVWRMGLAGSDRRAELRRLAGFAALSPVLLLMISPHLLLDYPTVIANLVGEARPQHLGSTGGNFFENALWYINGPLTDALGVGGLGLAAIGIVLFARERRIGLVILPVVTTHFVIICLHDLRWERWVVPLLAFLALAAAYAAVRLTALVRPLPVRGRPWAATAVFLPITLSLVWPAWQMAEARMNDTRQQATRWIESHVPADKTIMIEHFAFDLVHRAPTVYFPLAEAGCVNAQAMLDGRIDYRLVKVASKGRAKVDYGTMPPDARSTCKVDFAILTEMARYRTERARFPREYAAYTALLSEMDIRATFRAEPGKSAGPVVTILAARQPR